MPFQIIQKKNRLKIGIITVIIIHIFIIYGFWNVKARQLGPNIVVADIYGDSVGETLAFYEALPDENCVKVRNEYIPKPVRPANKTPVTNKPDNKSNTKKTESIPLLPELPFIAASAPTCVAPTVTPTDYARLGADAYVGLVLNLAETGAVERGEISKSSGFPDLDAAALKQVTETWRFKPCKKGDQAIACRQTIKFRWAQP